MRQSGKIEHKSQPYFWSQKISNNMNSTHRAPIIILIALVLSAFSNSFACSRVIPKIKLDTVSSVSTPIQVEVIALKNMPLRIASKDTNMYQRLSRDVKISDNHKDSCTIETSGYLTLRDSTWSATIEESNSIQIVDKVNSKKYRISSTEIDWISRRPTPKEDRDFKNFCMTAMLAPPILMIGLITWGVIAVIE